MAIWPIDLIWDDPTVARHLRRLASFSRLILVDILGAGSSDVVRGENAAIQAWTDGLLEVLDAVGSERASVIAVVGFGAACRASRGELSRIGSAH